MADYPVLDATGAVIIPAPGVPVKTLGKSTQIVTSKYDATVYIEDAAVGGIDEVVHNLGGDTSSTFVAGGRMDKLSLYLNGYTMTSPAHDIGHFTWMDITGPGTAQYMFGDEIKLRTQGSARIDNFSYIKPSIETLQAGSVGNLIMLDGDINTTVPDKNYLIYAPRPNWLIKTSGGILTDASLLVGNTNFTDNDSGEFFLEFAGATITVKPPATPGFQCTVMQGDLNKVTVQPATGASLFCYGGGGTHNKTAGYLACVQIIQMTTTVTGLTGDTGT